MVLRRWRYWWRPLTALLFFSFLRASASVLRLLTSLSAVVTLEDIRGVMERSVGGLAVNRRGPFSLSLSCVAIVATVLFPHTPLCSFVCTLRNFFRLSPVRSRLVT